MIKNLYFTEDCTRVLVGEREGGMVEVFLQEFDTSVFIPASEARGLAMKLILVATLAEKE